MRVDALACPCPCPASGFAFAETWDWFWLGAAHFFLPIAPGAAAVFCLEEGHEIFKCPHVVENDWDLACCHWIDCVM